jgi:hypothetical protein
MRKLIQSALLVIGTVIVLELAIRLMGLRIGR